uniref:Uncharacterized protein n=2 Tax=Chryseobacterium TaxID=59732 RepID=A0AAU6WR47_9FLAO
MINQPKNRMASWLMNRYGDRINTVIIYGILNSIPDVEVTGDLSYREFDKITKQLLVLNPDDIEKSITEKIQNLLLIALQSQLKSMAGSLLMIWVILMLIPWLEFWIYTYMMKRATNRNNQINK